MREILEHDPANGLLQFVVLPMDRAVVGKLGKEGKENIQ
jgi:hypothetical protein